MTAQKKKVPWYRAIRWAYILRFWWLDIPTIGIHGMYHWDYWSKGSNPILHAYPHVYAIILMMYWAIKEGIRLKKDIKPRYGGAYVLLWLLSFGLMGIWGQAYPGEYHLPYLMDWMTLYVLLGYLGMFRAKAFLEKNLPRFLERFPGLSSWISNNNNE